MFHIYVISFSPHIVSALIKTSVAICFSDIKTQLKKTTWVKDRSTKRSMRTYDIKRWNVSDQSSAGCCVNLGDQQQWMDHIPRWSFKNIFISLTWQMYAMFRLRSVVLVYAVICCRSLLLCLNLKYSSSIRWRKILYIRFLLSLILQLHSFQYLKISKYSW